MAGDKRDLSAAFNATVPLPHAQKPDVDSLAAPVPSAVAQQQVRQLCDEVADGNLDSALKALNRHSRDVADSPLLSDLLTDVLAPVHERVLDELCLLTEPPELRLVANVFCVMPERERRVIGTYNMLHLWPRGSRYPSVYALSRPRFACRRHQGSGHLYHAARGDWWHSVDGSGPSEPCPGCADDVSSFPESRTWLPAASVPRDLSEMMEKHMAPAVLVEALNLLVIEALVLRDLHSTVLRLYVDEWLPTVRETVLANDPERHIALMLPNFRHLRSNLPASSGLKGLADLLSPEDWRDLFDLARTYARQGSNSVILGVQMEEELTALVVARIDELAP